MKLARHSTCSALSVNTITSRDLARWNRDPRSIELTDQNSYDAYLRYEGIDDCSTLLSMARTESLWYGPGDLRVAFRQREAKPGLESRRLEVRDKIRNKSRSDGEGPQEQLGHRASNCCRNSIIALGDVVDGVRKIFSIAQVSLEDTNSHPTRAVRSQPCPLATRN